MLVFKWLAFAGLLSGAVASPGKSLAKRTTVSEILTDIEDATTCTACEVNYLFGVDYLSRDRVRLTGGYTQALLVVLQALAHLGNDDFVDVITEVCILAGVRELALITTDYY
jgi:sphingomyelin phosphodiesterase